MYAKKQRGEWGNYREKIQRDGAMRPRRTLHGRYKRKNSRDKEAHKQPQLFYHKPGKTIRQDNDAERTGKKLGRRIHRGLDQLRGNRRYAV